MGTRKSYSVRLSPEIVKALKLVAVKKEKTVSSLIEEAIKELLKKHKKGRIIKRRIHEGGGIDKRS